MQALGTCPRFGNMSLSLGSKVFLCVCVRLVIKMFFSIGKHVPTCGGKNMILWNPRAANSYKRCRRRSPGKSRLHHSRGSKPAARRHPNNTAGTSSWGFNVDAQCEKSSSAATTAPAAENVLAMRPRWLRPAGTCWGLRPRAHGAREPEIREQALTPESIAQLRQLDRRACVVRGAVRSRRGNRCNHCRVGIATRVGNLFQDRRRPCHQEHASGGAANHRLLEAPQPTPRDDSPAPDSPVRDIAMRESDTEMLGELRRASAVAIPRCVVSRYATAWERAWKERSMVISPGQSRFGIGAGFCRHQPTQVATAMLRRRVHMWESGEMHDLLEGSWDSCTPGNRIRIKMQPQTEQRGKRACAHTARGMEGLVGGAAAGTAEHRKLWTTALIPRSSGRSTHPTEIERAQVAHECPWAHR